MIEALRTTVNCVCVSHLARWLGVPVCICQGSGHGLWVCKALLLSNYPLCMQFNKAHYTGCWKYNKQNTIWLLTGQGSGNKTGAELQNHECSDQNLIVSDWKRFNALRGHTIKDTLSTLTVQYFINRKWVLAQSLPTGSLLVFFVWKGSAGILLGRDVTSNRWLTVLAFIARYQMNTSSLLLWKTKHCNLLWKCQISLRAFAVRAP